MIRNNFDPDVGASVTAAVNSLMLRFPLASLSMLGEAIVVEQDNSVSTMATDGRTIYVGPEWVRAKEPRDILFDLLHEWFHVFGNHCLRIGDRDRNLWNKAVDIIVIRECITVLSSGGEKWSVPEDGVQIPHWVTDGMTAEIIYDKLVEEEQKKPKPKLPTPPPQLGNQGGGAPPSGPKKRPPPPQEPAAPPKEGIQASADLLYDKAQTYTEKEEQHFVTQFASELAVAAVVMDNLGGPDYGKTVRDRLAQIKRGRIPWGRLLRGAVLDSLGADQPSWARPNRRYAPHVFLPTMVAVREQVLILLVDVSASVGKELLNVFASNVTPAASRASKTIVITFDQVVREIIVTRHPKDAIRQLKFSTGAHYSTSAVEAFAEGRRRGGTAFACLTDGYIHLPPKPVPNTVFAIPQNGKKQPWGRNYTMDFSW